MLLVLERRKGEVAKGPKERLTTNVGVTLFRHKIDRIGVVRNMTQSLLVRGGGKTTKAKLRTKSYVHHMYFAIDDTTLARHWLRQCHGDSDKHIDGSISLITCDSTRMYMGSTCTTKEILPSRGPK